MFLLVIVSSFAGREFFFSLNYPCWISLHTNFSSLSDSSSDSYLCLLLDCIEFAFRSRKFFLSNLLFCTRLRFFAYLSTSSERHSKQQMLQVVWFVCHFHQIGHCSLSTFFSPFDRKSMVLISSLIYVCLCVFFYGSRFD